MKTTHNLPFEVAPMLLQVRVDGNPFEKFRVGTCEGAWRATETSYEILAIENSNKGNGHLVDVFEWFEASCKRDGKTLKVLEFFNEPFKKHLIDKRGFVEIPNNSIEKTFAV